MKAWDAGAFFTGLPAFAKAPQAQVLALAEKSKLIPFAKGDYIFQENDTAEASWWVVDGIVKIAKAGQQGRLVTMELLMRGDIFAPTGIMNMNLYPANAIAVTNVEVVRVLKPLLTAFVRGYPHLVRDVLQQIGQRLQRTHRLRVLDTASSDKKVAATLLWLWEKTGLSFTLSRREISDIAGVAPETAIRAILHFKSKKWLTSGTRSITLISPESLQSFIEEDA